MTKIEELYQEWHKLEMDCWRAENNNNPEGVKEAQKAYQKLKARIQSRHDLFPMIIQDYKTSRDNGNELLNVWGCEGAEYMGALKRHGIKKFTITIDSAGSMEAVWDAKKVGYRIVDAVKVSAGVICGGAHYQQDGLLMELAE